jgi:hypothetical protein
MRMSVTLAGLGLFMLFAPGLAGARAYECRDQDGTRVFTDDPTGWQGCTALKLNAQPGPPPEQSPKEMDIREGALSTRPRVPALSSVPPPPADGVGPKADAPFAPDPEYGPTSKILTPSSDTCAQGINRLNPFGAGPCGPSTSPAPTAVPYEQYFR